MSAVMEWLRGAVMAVAALFGGAADPAVFYGYAEGEYARLAPREAGTLQELRVARGDRVMVGDIVAVLEADAERAARDEARARLAQAEAQLENLRKGRRSPEIDALIAQRRQAEAQLQLSEQQLRRYSRLPVGEVVSQERMDETRAAYARDRARVAELAAQIEVARMAARDDEILAADAGVETARAVLRQAEWKLGQRTLAAPAAGLVADTLFVAGEFVTAGTPVVSLLPDGKVKLKFFVPEPALARLRIGQDVAVRCDACPPDLAARVSFVAPEAEYTPPVIYSRETRGKLVFLVEAQPLDGARFHPGQPIEVSLPRAP
jgi:HlyD family secretion protein